MSEHESTSEIIKSLVVNVLIACSKGVAAAITGSGAMLAETLHSFADCGNQLLLLRGVRATRKPADREHPLGYGRALYFYSFIVALLLFSGGGVFSIWEGIHKVQHPEPVGDITVALVILCLSMLLEGWSLYGNIRVMNKRRGTKGLWRYLRDTKDSDLIVVAGENSAAVVGLVLALGAIVLAKETGDGRWDAIGSIAIGVTLVFVATFLAREVKSLLVGEAADESLVAEIEAIAALDKAVVKVLRVLTLQQGPGEIIVAAKLQFQSGIESDALVEHINEFERQLKARVPDVKWSFIEPDNAD
ncbi:MAG TPA: cation diffusion facilitator family transporter [Kofleriaceae bacterium]